MRGSSAEGDTNITKRKREEWEKEIETAFKKSNRLKRIPPNIKRQEEEKKKKKETDRIEEEGKSKEGSGELTAILKEIKAELSEMRKEMKEMKAKMEGLKRGGN